RANMQNQALTTFTNLLRSSDFARQIRRNSVTEAACQIIGRGCILKLHQINMNLEVTPDDILVDCGANVGQITSLFARTGATVHSFEPNPRCVETLRKRFRFVPNVTIHHAGVMDSACKLTLRVPSQKDTTSWETSVAGTFLRNATPIDGEFDEYEVQCVDLASWVLSQPRRIRLMKLDIEGAEVAVIS